jgi:glycosyltransferase involved in cell wall biosynthesis
MKPKVLIFIDWFVPGHRAGGPLTSNIHIIERFRREIEFYVLTRNTDYCEPLPYEGIPANEWVDLKEGLKVFYFSKDYLSMHHLRQVAREADCRHWYINGVYSLYFSILPLLLAKGMKGVRVTVASRGMLSPHALAVSPVRKRLFLSLFKWAGLYRDVTFHASNEEEAGEIRKQLGRDRLIHIAPNLSAPAPDSNPHRGRKIRGQLRLVSMARISPEKNILGALQLLESVKHAVVFELFGQAYDAAYLMQCEAQVGRLPAHVEVHFRGSIPATEVPQVLAEADFLFLPTHGENFGHAILEALLAGCPVIISDRTPWRGLEAKGIGWDIPLSDTGRFAEALEQAAAMDEESYTKMSDAAFDEARQITENPRILEANRRVFGL